MTNKPTPEVRESAFMSEVIEAGLTPRICTEYHWQIRGGVTYSLVNCWSTKKKGFRYSRNGGPTTFTGSVADAIRLATPPPRTTFTPKEKSSDPPWREEADSVGLIRRCWRIRIVQWFWRKVW